MAPCNTNCTLWDYGFFDPADYPNYEADPDIAGIGVSLSCGLKAYKPTAACSSVASRQNRLVNHAAQVVTTFVASAFITLCFSVANIILTAFTSSDTNAIDYWVFKITRSLAWFEVTDRTRDLWIPVIEKVVLNLSDQQILTGLAVLIAGFWTHCSISVYHFALLSDLAWFSSNTHLISLGVLRSYFQDKDRVLLRNTRVGLMICMALLLIVSTVLQGHWAWYDSWSFDAQCLFDNLNGNIGGKPRYWMVVYLCLIAFDYTWSMVLLFKVDQWLYDKPKQLFDHALEKYKAKKSESAGQNCLPSIIKRIYHTGIIACAITIRAMHFGLAALLGSRCTDLAVNIFWFSYGLWGLIEDRNIPQSLMDGNENIMSFGQIVPILLISSTVFVFWELYNGKCSAVRAWIYF